MATPQLQPGTWETMIRAVELVRERALRVARAFESAGIPYAIIGGNAVAAWVAGVDPAAVRNTQDVDVLLRREDMDRARTALEAEGFEYRRVKSIDMFIDRKTGGKARDAVHVLLANEYVRAGDLAPTADVAESVRGSLYQILELAALVRMKLTSFRLKDRVHLLDMIDVGLVDASWLDRLPPELAARLKELLDNPEGLPSSH